MITFTVFGEARPAGSKRAFALRRKDGTLVTRPGGAPVINVTDDNAQARGWKQECAKAALLARAVTGRSGALLDGPVAVVMEFYRPRPKGHSGKQGLSKAGREARYPTTKPDVLKLARAVEDALTGVLWRDDAQIVDEILRKAWGEPARVVVTVEEM